MAEVEANCLLSGYNEVFVNPVDKDLLCKLCQLPSREPKQIMHCGDRFCSKCIDEYFQRQERKDKYLTCPLHVKLVLERDKDVFPDTAAKRKISSLDIRCGNGGCKWTGELKAKEVRLKK
ncbi:TNF receptor-associated factor 4-like [Oculina patagonica]